VRVVVLFEFVDVREKHREGATQPPRALHFARERAHQMPAIVQTGEGVGEGEPLQLALPLALSQSCHQRVERSRQVSKLAAPAGRKLHGEIAGSRACGGLRQSHQRPGDERGDQDGQERDDHQQYKHDQGGAQPSPIASCRGRVARRLRHGGPPQLRNPPQHGDDLITLRS